MKKMIRTILFLLIVSVFLPYNAEAQLPDTLRLEFDFVGAGNAVMDSPPLYAGDIVDGDELVVDGTWWVELDDSDWPATTDPGARWDYIFDNHFDYDPVSFTWTAVFDGNTLPEKPTWGVEHSTNGTMTGTLVVLMTLYDYDMNGELSADERAFGLFAGTFIVMKYGTGCFANYCGDGAYNGSLTNEDPVNFADDAVDGSCILDLINCSIGVEEASWSYIKSVFK